MLDKNRNIIKLDLTKQYRLEKLVFRKFRNLDGMEINFSGHAITGIFGANGLGKSSILATIRCLYQAVYNPRVRRRKSPLHPRPENCANEPFGHLFYGNQYFNYNNSEIVAEFSDALSANHGIITSPLYEIQSSRKRWTPGTTAKPVCPVYYINMETCIPVSEAGMLKSEREKRRKLYRSILTHSEELKTSFNKIFLHQIQIYNNTKATTSTVDDTITIVLNNKQLPFRELSAGEQRVLKLLDMVYRAQENSIILIDEIETTLHPFALDNLVTVLNKLARDKHLQIIFTSHSLRLAERKDINVRTLYSIGGIVRCDLGYNQECRKLLEGKNASAQLIILVEDDMSCALLMEILRQNGKLSNVEFSKFGGYEQAFNLAASLHKVGKLTKDIVFVLDGDVVISTEEKKEQIRKNPILSSISNADVDNIANHFIQYNLPEGKKIDSYMHELLTSETDINDPIVIAAKSVVEYTMDTIPEGIKNKEQDKRRFLDHYKLQDTVVILGYKGENQKIGLQKIVEHIAMFHKKEWNELTKDIVTWISNNM